MSRFEDGCYGSLKGIALIAKVLAGRCKMHYTRVAAGKGAIPDDLTPKTIDEPPGYVMDAMISSVTNPIDGECQVSVQINSANVKDGFYLTWLLLYAEDPDEGEIPFTALCLESEPEWIRPSSSIVGKLATFDIIAAVGDVDTVSASIDPEAVATIAEIKRKISEHNADPNAHGDTITETVNARLEEMAEGGEIVTPEAVEDIVKEEIAKQQDGGVVRAEHLDLVIPVEGWEPDTDTEGIYPFHRDIANAQIDEDTVPIITILPTSLAAASACGLCPTAVTGPGYFRLYAKTAPTSAIAMSAVLIGDVRGCEDVTVPTSGWVDDEDTDGAYPLRIDIASTVASEDLTPMLTILPDSLEAAGNCGLCLTVQSLDGALRFYAQKAPEAPIHAKLSMLGADFPVSAPTIGNVPIASHTTPGGVILGEDFDITPCGVMSLNRDKVITADNLVDEDAIHQEIVDALHAEGEAK